MIGGAGGELVGAALDGTVVLAPAGISTAVASAGLIGYGGTATYRGVKNYFNDANDLISNITEGGSNSKLPNQGTVNGNVEGAPSVDAGKQGKHVPGHNNNNPSKSQWPNGETGVDLTQEAWMNGTPVKPDGSVRVYDNGSQKIKVHMDSNGNLHGYPIDK